MIGILIALSVIGIIILGGSSATGLIKAQQELSAKSDIQAETSEVPNTKSKTDFEASGEVADDQDEDGEDNLEGQKPDNTKVAAFNIKSGKEMPTLIPQVAVDNSLALEVSQGNNDENNEEGKEVETQSKTSTNAGFGKQVSVSAQSSTHGKSGK